LGSYCEFKAWQSTFRRGFHKEESASVETGVEDEAAAAEAAEAPAPDDEDADDGPAGTSASDLDFLLTRKNQTRLAEAELSSMNSQRGMMFDEGGAKQTERSEGGEGKTTI
jgi:hypothetical protein